MEEECPISLRHGNNPRSRMALAHNIVVAKQRHVWIYSLLSWILKRSRRRIFNPEADPGNSYFWSRTQFLDNCKG